MRPKKRILIITADDAVRLSLELQLRVWTYKPLHPDDATGEDVRCVILDRPTIALVRQQAALWPSAAIIVLTQALAVFDAADVILSYDLERRALPAVLRDALALLCARTRGPRLAPLPLVRKPVAPGTSRTAFALSA